MEKIKIKSSSELQNEIHACENIIKVQQEEINKIMTEKTAQVKKSKKSSIESKAALRRG